MKSTKQGYKFTKVGIIPIDWECEPLGCCLSLKPQYGINKAAIPWQKSKSTYIRITDISNDGKYTPKHKASVDSNDPNYLLKNGDILFARTGASVGKSYLYSNKDGPLIFAGFLIRISTNEKLIPKFLSSYVQCNHYWQWVKVMSKRSGQPGLNGNEYSLLPIPIPPLPEQKKIATILSTWDRAIDQQQTIIATKTRRKHGLMQHLLTGKKRLPNFKGKWITNKLDEVISLKLRPKVKPKKHFLAAGIRCHGKGVFLKENFKPSAIALDELFELKENDLVVNITFAWEGAIAIVKKAESGALVSHRFPTHTFNKHHLPNFYKYVVLGSRFRYDLGLASPGGAGRNRVLRKKELLMIDVPTPSIEEQQAIAKVLDTATSEIETHQQQLIALREQKRGLMQKLLTGEIRVIT